MVVKYLLLIVSACVLIGCSEADKPTSNHEQISTIPKTENTVMRKDEYDKEYFKSLRELNLSEKDFLIITKYIIELAEKNDFPDIDPILGQKKYMVTKAFNDPYSFYNYANIPSHHGTEVVLKYKKIGEKLERITIRPSGSQNDFILKESNINILNALNLKLIKKEQFTYSNQLAEYQLSDGTLKYQVVAKNNSLEDNLPKEFYSFDIYIE